MTVNVRNQARKRVPKQVHWTVEDTVRVHNAIYSINNAQLSHKVRSIPHSYSAFAMIMGTGWFMFNLFMTYLAWTKGNDYWYYMANEWVWCPMFFGIIAYILIRAFIRSPYKY